MKNFIYKNLVVTLGSLICGAVINMFFLKHHLLSGGISGIAFITYYLSNIPIGLMTIAMNIPLFYLAWKHMDKEYFYGALYGMLVFSAAIDGLSFLQAYTPEIQDKILSCAVGAVIYGIGIGLVYRVGGSTGGMDIVGAIINKNYSISQGTTIFAVNIVIFLAATFFLGIEAVVYTMLTSFIVYKVTNSITIGFDYKKSIIIISENPDAIAEGIIQIVGRGVTYLYGEGAYTHNKRKVLFVVAKLTQVAKIRQIVSTTDPGAFMIIQDAADVFGQGFTSTPSAPNPERKLNPANEQSHEA